MVRARGEFDLAAVPDVHRAIARAAAGLTAPATVVVEPGRQAAATVTITAPRAPTGQEVTLPFSVTATDSKGVSSNPLTIVWYVDTLAWNAIPTQSTPHSTTGRRGQTNTGSLSLAGYVTGGTGGNQYALVSGPAWATPSGSTINVIAPYSTDSQTLTVQVTDSKGYSVQTTFTWTIR